MKKRRQHIATGYEATESANDNFLLDLRFRRLLSPAQWKALPSAVQSRFCKRLGPGEARVYKGYIQYTRMNRLGRVLAQTLKLIGAPIPLDVDNENQPAVVTVTEDANGKGQFWTRQYGRPKGFPHIIHSTKRFTGPTGLFEYVGFGIGMSLKLEVSDEALHFLSERYYLGFGRWRMALPRWMTPGHIDVGHADHGDGWFEFTLKLQHPLFGLLVDQSGMFFDED